MIDVIASKNANSEGQLEELDDISVIQTDNYRVLISNQYADIKSILELAGLNLILSSGQMIKKLCRAIYLIKNLDVNAREATAIIYLMNAIVYYNASFDYLKLLIRIVYSNYDDFINDFPRDKIDKIMDKFQLETDEWESALRKIISEIKPKKFKEWLKGKLSNSIIKKYNELQNLNKDLRFKYQVNRLKHQALPHFLRSDPKNAIGMRCFISIDQFYDNKNSAKSSFSFGFPSNSLSIDETQKFLIRYNNKTVEVVKELKLAERFNAAV